MIHVEPFEQLPSELLLNLSDISKAEWQRNKHIADVIVRDSHHKYVFRWDGAEGPVLCALGLFQITVIGRPAELWLLTSNELQTNYKRYVRKLHLTFTNVADMIPEVIVTCETPTSQRFAQFFGFTEAVNDITEVPAFRRPKRWE